MVCVGCGCRPKTGRKFCQNCGGEVKEKSEICLKCGVRLAAGKDTAVVSLVLGLVGILAWLLPIIGFPVTIAGLIFGIRNLNSARRGMAIAGIVLSSSFLLLTAINSLAGALCRLLEVPVPTGY